MNPVTEQLAAISGLQPAGKRVIAVDLQHAPVKIAPVPVQPAPRKARKAAVWSPERLARHRKMMQGLWSDPTFRKRQAKVARARMKQARSNPEWEAKRLAHLKAAFAAKKVSR